MQIDVQGVWWLPDNPEHKVAGWFTYDAEEGGTLRLAGALRPPSRTTHQRPDGGTQRLTKRSDDRLYPTIHGQSGHQVFHLGDAFQVSLTEELCREDDHAEKLHVNWLITGALFADDGQPEVHRVVADLQYLTSWVDNDALSLDWESVPDDTFAVARAARWRAMRIPIAGDRILALEQSLSGDGDHHNEVILKQRIQVTVTSDGALPLGTFTDEVGFIQDLLTIATDRIANVERLHFAHREVLKLSLAGTPIGMAKEELRYFTRWANRDADHGRMSPYEMAFTLEDIGGIAGIGRWMTVAHRYRSELRRVMATRYSPSMFVEDKVANCIAALESIDVARRGSKKADLIDRLRVCADFAGPTFAGVLGGESVSDWADRAKSHRHALAHHNHRFRNDMELVEHELGAQAYWLAVLCLLREAEMPEAVFDGIGKSAGFRWHGTRAAARSKS